MSEPGFQRVSQISHQIVEACRAMGFASAGVCAAAPAGFRPALEAWLAEGRAGSMDWMHEWIEQRADIRKLLDIPDPGRARGRSGPSRPVRSVIVVADQYAAPGLQEQPLPPADPTGRIARYARGRDYHAVVRRRLHTLSDALRARFPGEAFRSFVDTAPVMEREHAARAGLGFIGKHTLLIDPRRGSYLLLGGVATTLEIEPTGGGDVESHCGTCTRCIDACPTGAIEPYRVDARKCISYLTIEHEGPIDPTLHGPMGDWLFGCDVCQDVCPFNASLHSSAAPPPRVHPLYREREGLAGGRLKLLDVLRWSQSDRRVALTVSAGRRASLDMLRRNAVIAAGNQVGAAPGAGLREELERIAASDPAPVVRQTACEVLSRPPGG